jgi:hypothetical protein
MCAVLRWTPANEFATRFAFGVVSRYYAYNFTQLSTFTNMNMSLNTGGPGRSYKYLQDQSLALWPFGFGLSYTTFSLSSASTTQLGRAGGGGGGGGGGGVALVVLQVPAWASSDAASHFAQPLQRRRWLASRAETEAVASASVTVTNTGAREGDEVVFLFKNATAAVRSGSSSSAFGGPDATVAHRELVAYARVSLAPGESATVQFNITAESLSTVDSHGTRHVLPGTYQLVFSRGHGDEPEVPVEVVLVPAEEEDEATVDAPRPQRLVLSTMLSDRGGRA